MALIAKRNRQASESFLRAMVPIKTAMTISDITLQQSLHIKGL